MYSQEFSIICGTQVAKVDVILIYSAIDGSHRMSLTTICDL